MSTSRCSRSPLSSRWGRPGGSTAGCTTHVRALQGFRAPARFAILACCALAILAGFGFQVLRRIVVQPRAQKSLLVAVLVVVGLEYGSAPMTLAEVPTAVPDLYKTIKQMEPSPLIEFPMADLDLSVDYMYWSIYHWHPLINGYSGYIPPDYTETRRVMLSFPDARSLRAAAGTRCAPHRDPWDVLQSVGVPGHDAASHANAWRDESRAISRLGRVGRYFRAGAGVLTSDELDNEFRTCRPQTSTVRNSSWAALGSPIYTLIARSVITAAR